MRVAAVIPHWNRASLLRTLLENLKEQTRPFDEIIVVDNGSTDGSAVLAEQLGARVVRLDRNYGFAVAVNSGFMVSDTEFVAVLNNDVTLDPRWLYELLGVMGSVTAAEVQDATLRATVSSPNRLLEEYGRCFGTILNADNAAELFPEYSKNLATRARFRVAVHPAAQWVRDQLFRRVLADDLVREIVFTAGGNGAGKTSAVSPDDVVYDSTLNNADFAQRTIDECLDAGKRVLIVYVYRPVVASFLGVLDRARTEGRVVAIDTVIRTHTEAAKTVADLVRIYEDDPRVTVRFIDNSGTLPVEGDLALTATEHYASSRDELFKILESRRDGLPDYLYEAASGSRVRSEGGSESSADDRESREGREIQASPEVAFATGKILSATDHFLLDGAWDEVSRAACPVRMGAGVTDSPAWNSSQPIAMASMTAVLIRRDTFTTLGPLDERFESYLEDVDFGLRSAKAGLSGVYEPSAIAYHQGSSTWGRWNPDTVRLLSRNQVLLFAKHFRGQPLWPVLVGQLLWGLVALRHGCGWAWLEGKLAGGKMAPAIENDTRDPQTFARFLRVSEAAVLDGTLGHGREFYWRLYAWLAPLR